MHITKEEQKICSLRQIIFIANNTFDNVIFIVFLSGLTSCTTAGRPVPVTSSHRIPSKLPSRHPEETCRPTTTSKEVSKVSNHVLVTLIVDSEKELKC